MTDASADGLSEPDPRQRAVSRGDSSGVLTVRAARMLLTASERPSIVLVGVPADDTREWRAMLGVGWRVLVLTDDDHAFAGMPFEFSPLSDWTPTAVGARLVQTGFTQCGLVVFGDNSSQGVQQAFFDEAPHAVFVGTTESSQRTLKAETPARGWWSMTWTQDDRRVLAAGLSRVEPAEPTADDCDFAEMTRRWAERSFLAEQRMQVENAALRSENANLNGQAVALDASKAELVRAHALLGHYAARIRSMEASRAWRMTVPIRRTADLVRRVRNHTQAAREGSVGEPDKLTNLSKVPRLSASSVEESIRARYLQVQDTLALPGDDARAAVAAYLETHSALSKEWWLVASAIGGTLPRTEELEHLESLRFVRGIDEALRHIERQALEQAYDLGHIPNVTVINRRVLVDGSFTSATTLNTGVQRVARNTIPVWYALGAVPIVMDASAQHWRFPTVPELRNLNLVNAEAMDHRTIVVPWDSDILEPELKPPAMLDAIDAATTLSTNRFSWIAYDLIPLTNPSYVEDAVIATHGRYVSVLAHAHRLVAISQTAAADFNRYMRLFDATKPKVSVVPLPTTPPPEARIEGARAAAALRQAPQLHLVLYVGSISRHKNQETFLDVCEASWNRGLQFEVMFVSPNAWHKGALSDRIIRLSNKGRPVSLLRDLQDPTLWALYRQAHLTVLLSRAEGFGLPIVESLSVGVPVLTSDYGSMAEIAGQGGVASVNPEDRVAISEVFEKLLADDAYYANLRRQVPMDVCGSWADYATKAWNIMSQLDEGRSDDEPFNGRS